LYHEIALDLVGLLGLRADKRRPSSFLRIYGDQTSDQQVQIMYLASDAIRHR
jgi:hypothetical protein